MAPPPDASQELALTLQVESADLGLHFAVDIPMKATPEGTSFRSLAALAAKALSSGIALDMNKADDMRRFEESLQKRAERRQEEQQFYVEVGRTFGRMATNMQTLKRDYYREVEHLRQQISIMKRNAEYQPDSVVFFDPASFQIPTWEAIVELLDDRRAKRELLREEYGTSVRNVPVWMLCEACRRKCETKVDHTNTTATQTELDPGAQTEGLEVRCDVSVQTESISGGCCEHCSAAKVRSSHGMSSTSAPQPQALSEEISSQRSVDQASNSRSGEVGAGAIYTDGHDRLGVDRRPGSAHHRDGGMGSGTSIDVSPSESDASEVSASATDANYGDRPSGNGAVHANRRLWKAGHASRDDQADTPAENVAWQSSHEGDPHPTETPIESTLWATRPSPSPPQRPVRIRRHSTDGAKTKRRLSLSLDSAMRKAAQEACAMAGEEGLKSLPAGWARTGSQEESQAAVQQTSFDMSCLSEGGPFQVDDMIVKQQGEGSTARVIVHRRSHSGRRAREQGDGHGAAAGLPPAAKAPAGPTLPRIPASAWAPSPPATAPKACIPPEQSRQIWPLTRQSHNSRCR